MRGVLAVVGSLALIAVAAGLHAAEGLPGEVVTVGDVIAPLFGPVDWERLLLPTTPLLETVIRGSFVYLALFALLRFVFRRESGAARISRI